MATWLLVISLNRISGPDAAFLCLWCLLCVWLSFSRAVVSSLIVTGYRWHHRHHRIRVLSGYFTALVVAFYAVIGWGNWKNIPIVYDSLLNMSSYKKLLRHKKIRKHTFLSGRRAVKKNELLLWQCCLSDRITCRWIIYRKNNSTLYGRLTQKMWTLFATMNEAGKLNRLRLTWQNELLDWLSWQLDYSMGQSCQSVITARLFGDNSVLAEPQQ